MSAATTAILNNAAAAANILATPSAASETEVNAAFVSAAAIAANQEAVAATTTNASQAVPTAPICRYFLRGICRFGTMCRFSHDPCGGEVITNTHGGEAAAVDQQPSTSRRSWINAPIFVPGRPKSITDYAEVGVEVAEEAVGGAAKSWAEVVGGDRNAMQRISYVESGSVDMVCPYEPPCPYGDYCAYSVHLELCKMCDQFCLHPTDQAQRRKHNQECLQQHEQAMELSFAISRSKDKTCGICFDTIMEKSGREKRFGILPNCNHIFCLECIRKWRQAKQFEHKITRSCPECRVCSDFVCPSAFWVETKEEKDKLLNDYRSALNVKDCKYFKKGEGKCPFGNKCFYKHALPDGKLVDVGCPKRARKLQRSTNEFIDLLDIYLWEFVDQRDYHWLDMISSSDESDAYSDWSDDY